ncbi:unnamed protein product, partial [Chrysoparadoxa australica]
QAIDGIRGALAPAGIDLVVGLAIKWYNNCVPDHLHLATPSFGENGVAVLIGNTANLWEPFKQAVKEENLCGRGSSHPLNDYVKTKVVTAIEQEVSVTAQYRWEHETAPERVVAIQRMGQAAGLAFLDEKTYLSLHPTYGPWIAFRAVVLLDMEFPKDIPKPAPMTCPATDEEMAAAAKGMSEALEKAGEYSNRTDGAWELFLKARDMYILGKQHRYCDEMVTYHYGKSLSYLEGIAHG